MKTSIMSKYAMLALFSASFIALNNCGNQSNSTEDASYKPVENGSASDLAILGAPGYPVFTGGYLPILSVETACGNGVDDDGDGLTDCGDNDCHIHPECSEFGPPLEEIDNSRALTIYPNGILVPEDVAFLKTRAYDQDDQHGWNRTAFFATSIKDCWIDPLMQDPYNFVALGEPLVAGPQGPIGPQLLPPVAPVIGPRRGLINECEEGTDLFEFHFDDDNGDGAGAGGDFSDDEGGT
jgi:hypothetical protein